MQRKRRRSETYVEHWRRAYDSLNQEYLVLRYADPSSSCRQHRDKTEAYDTLLLCKECSTVDETKRSLELKLEKVRQEVRYRQDYYETLLGEHFKHDRGSNGGSHQRA